MELSGTQKMGKNVTKINWNKEDIILHWLWSNINHSEKKVLRWFLLYDKILIPNILKKNGYIHLTWTKCAVSYRIGSWSFRVFTGIKYLVIAPFHEDRFNFWIILSSKAQPCWHIEANLSIDNSFPFTRVNTWPADPGFIIWNTWFLYDKLLSQGLSTGRSMAAIVLLR